ncbi:MAG: hemerythrin domain-containing protein [Candidatus Marinimicrobia bacterium]|nr:hemerythrin domain-containing protein [Candidatus Neomarinimicrobiota bacterium]
MFEQLPEGHMIKTMVTEHEHILAMLDELQDISLQLSDNDRNNGMASMNRANELADKIIGAEPHHQREELVLFSTLEELGISGPTQVMRMEHEMMREMKHDLKSQTGNADGDWSVRVEKVSQLISELCSMLRQHIDKENNILYPIALQSITADTQWEEMRIRCDDIGYCCFCPETQKELDGASI